jgi:hypothetical protein
LLEECKDTTPQMTLDLMYEDQNHKENKRMKEETLEDNISKRKKLKTSSNNKRLSKKKRKTQKNKIIRAISKIRKGNVIPERKEHRGKQ